ncbi:phage tail tape measure protein [Mannheimia massilioguelmaensis]|uniref:phage tail tape measure protein n=1 Tax=Mannheimia massilioguelmaensis TaxID=1604354 RepID=UPI0005C80445|nr:phage tail tape measure protein [Mannheimia massilioguelmaensis]
MANMDLSLTLKAKDYASSVVKSVENSVSKSTKNIENQAQRSATTQQRAVRQTAQVTEQSYRQIQQAARSRETIGVRSERSIQNEINRTRAAYDQLKRSGIASGRELDRAAMATKRRIAELNAEMGKVSMGQKFGNVMRVGGAMVAGAIGVKNTIAPALNDKKQWDSNVAEVALTAFNDKSAEYIQTEGFARINKAVLDTVEKHGTADQALQGLDGMLKGGMSFDEAVANLDVAQKMQIAGNASGQDVGSLVKTLSDYGFKGDDLSKALEMTLQSGYEGKFEISDMISKLPSILSTAKNNSYSGIEDFKFILAWLQSAANKAGSNDEAATNVTNALNKQTAADTVTRLKKLDHPALKGKGIDVEQSMLEGAKRGDNPTKVLIKIVDEMLKSDKEYQALRKKLAQTTKDTEKQEIQRQLDLKRGFLIAQVMPDTQAKAGLIAAADKEQVEPHIEKLDQNKLGQGIDKAVEIKNSTAAAVEARAESLKFMHAQSLLGNVNEAGKAYDQWFIDNMKDHPELAGAAQVASVAGTAAMYGLGGYMVSGLGGLGSGVTATTGAGLATGASKAAKILRIGGGATLGLGVGALVMASDNYVYAKAVEEAQQEKFNAETKDSQQAFYSAAYPSKSVFQYAPPVPAPEKSVWSLASGGYALGDAAKRKEIADERLKRGTLTQDEYNRRVQVPDYKAEFQQLGNTITEGMKQAVESQNFTIQNQIRVDLDSRTIAESTSENQYRELKRG